jgi:hypothetical protein
MIRNALRLMIVCAVGACTVVPSGSRDPGQAESVDEIVSSPMEAVIPPTPAMLAAALSGDPDAMANAIGPRSCIAPSSCPSQFGSCGTWSAFDICDSTCTTQLCAGGAEGRLERLKENSFRVCFDAVGNSCTEWRQGNATQCGC